MTGLRQHRITRWVVPGLFGVGALVIAMRTGSDVTRAADHDSLRAWLVVVYGVLRTCVLAAFATFTIGRPEPARHARSPLAVVACAAAMATVVVFSAPSASTPYALLVVGELAAVAACGWLLVSVLALGRCFGVLPEARGLVTRGPYRLVRHPVYLGEIGACVGLAIAAPSARNAVAVGAVVIAQNVRMRLEESALTEAFADYARYAADTPRILPRLARLRNGAGATSVWHRPLASR